MKRSTDGDDVFLGQKTGINVHDRSAAMNFMLGCRHQVNERRIVFFVFISMVNLCRATLLDETLMLADYTGKRLGEIAEVTTGRTHFQKVFSDLLQNDSLKIFNVNGMELIKEFSKELERQVESKNAVLTKVKRKAEEYYQPNENSNNNDLQFFNMKDYNASGRPILKVDPKFFSVKPVNTSLSGHHIPTNVYPRKPAILNVIKQRQKLDKIYEDNYREQSNLLWQYIGSYNGVLSMYPGYEWGNPPDSDRYDCRRRGWYTTGSSSAKDAVILLDRSGSMAGTNWKIAIASINIIIESLQENDFFNVVQFNSNAAVVHDCYKNLVQATKANREAILNKVAKLPGPSGYANGKKALEKAYKLLQEASKSDLTSSGCHQVVFIISDEIEDFEDMKKVLEKHSDMKVRIFAYQIGRGSKNKKALQYISCKSLGQFFRLETIGNAYDFVLDYVRVLGTPIALSGQAVGNVPIYVPVYIDWETRLPIFSVVLPVVNNTKNSGLLGVAAQDITLIELENTVPVHKLGVYGYGFAVNNNGFVLFHHRLSFLQRVNTFSPTTTLEAVEFNNNNKSTVLTKKMIDRETGSLEARATILITPDKKERTLETNISYFFMPVKNTPFTAGIAIQEYGLKQIKTSTHFSINFSEAVRSLNSTQEGTKITIAPWPYCNVTAEAQMNMPTIYKFFPIKSEIVSYLSQFNETPANCDKELTDKLLLSAQKVEEIASKKWNITRNRINGIISTFISTHSGYTRIQFTSGNRSLGNIGNKSIREIFYLRAAAVYKEVQPNYVFSTVNVTDGAPSFYVKVVAPIVVGNKDTIAAVTGFTMWQKSVADIIMNPEIQKQNQELDCSIYSKFGCYLIDADGFVVAWNSKNQLKNNFFGYSEGLVMRHLVDQGIFIKSKFNDEQAECTPELKVNSSASRISNVIFGCIYCLFQSILMMFTSVFYGLLVDNGSVSSVAASSARLVYCIQEMTFYKVDETKLPISGETKDYICRKNFSMAKVPSTNLYLIVTDRRNPACNQKDWKLLREAVKLPEKCENKLRYRKRTNSSCSRYHKDEKLHCTSDASKSDIHSLFIILWFFINLASVAT
ncbi:voltage-dependent calcium channel subunit alpha-2/delta-3-like [Rhopilema esculentum]|uniref:voltage-dependent calcium channel subunit alpha-2/delta-3-like n=1 Tax=Rhopilema esculentum TaxID=499914 RepID=UPI0031D0B2AA